MSKPLYPPEDTMMAKILEEADRDLLEKLEELHETTPQLRELPFLRAALVIMWLGVNALEANHNILKGSHVS